MTGKFLRIGTTSRYVSAETYPKIHIELALIISGHFSGSSSPEGSARSSVMRTVIAAPDPPAMIESNDQYYGEQYSNEGGSRDGDEEIVENEDEEELTESEVEIEFEYGDEVLYEEEEQVDGGSRVTREGTENVGQDNVVEDRGQEGINSTTEEWEGEELIQEESEVPQSQVANYEETAEPYEDYREYVDDQPWRETVEQNGLGNDAEEGQYDQDYMEYERWDEDVAGNNDQRDGSVEIPENVEQSRAVGNDSGGKEPGGKEPRGKEQDDQFGRTFLLKMIMCLVCAMFVLLSGLVGVILFLVLRSDDPPAVSTKDTPLTEMPSISPTPPVPLPEPTALPTAVPSLQQTVLPSKVRVQKCFCWYALDVAHSTFCVCIPPL